MVAIIAVVALKLDRCVADTELISEESLETIELVLGIVEREGPVEHDVRRDAR